MKIFLPKKYIFLNLALDFHTSGVYILKRRMRGTKDERKMDTERTGTHPGRKKVQPKEEETGNRPVVEKFDFRTRGR